MWGNQGRRWLRPEAATEKLQVDGEHGVNQQPAPARCGRAEWKGPAADGEVSSYGGTRMEHGASTGSALHSRPGSNQSHSDHLSFCPVSATVT